MDEARKEEIRKAAAVLLKAGISLSANDFDGNGFFTLATPDEVAEHVAEYDRWAAEYVSKRRPTGAAR